jgi:hypothetical protein
LTEVSEGTETIKATVEAREWRKLDNIAFMDYY